MRRGEGGREEGREGGRDDFTVSSKDVCVILFVQLEFGRRQQRERDEEIAEKMNRGKKQI